MGSNFDRVMDERKKLVDQIVENMKNGYIIPKAQWNAAAFQIHNPISGARYHGANMLKLYLTSINNGYQDNRWMTFKQAASKGYHVKQGEKGIRLEKYIFDKVIEKENPDTGEMEKVRVKLSKPMINTFVVFNAEQIDGIPELVPPEIKQQDSEVWEVADNLIASSECPIKEEPQEKAYYSPQTDSITLPPREVFTSPEAFTTTLIHEMCHSTGHESRLNRNLINEYGSPEYALEELRAELGAFFMGSDLGIEGSEELLASHTQYLESWISVLENDPNELFRAMSDSQKAVDRLTTNLEIYQEQILNREEDYQPVKMDLDEYLGRKGLSSPMSNYTLDKIRIPHGETYRQQQKRLKDTEKAIEEYSQRRNSAIEEYNSKVEAGEIIPRTTMERTLLKAQGHPDNASTQAARRMLVKRGFMSEQELNDNIRQWDAISTKVAIESTVDYSEPEVGFVSVATDNMPAGTKYRLVTFGDKGNLVPYQEPDVMYLNREELHDYIEDHKDTLEVMNYDDMVYEAGIKKAEYTMLQHKMIENGLHSFEFEDGYLHFGLDINGYSYDGLYRIYDPVNGKSREIVSFNDYDPAMKENWDFIRRRLTQYVNEHPIIGVNGELIPRERPSIYCEWSEHGAFQDGAVYTPSEFSRIMETSDKEWIKLRKVELQQYGDDAFGILMDQGLPQHQTYAKVKYEIYIPGMEPLTVRQDIGDGFGSVTNFLEHNGYKIYADKINENINTPSNLPSEEKLNSAIDKVMEQMDLHSMEMELDM